MVKRNTEVLKNVSGFQTIPQKSMSYNKRGGMITLYFFCAPDQDIYKHINYPGGNKHASSSIPRPERERKDQCQFQAF